MKTGQRACSIAKALLIITVLLTTSAASAGQSGPSPVEDVTLRTVDSKTYHNPDGSSTVRFYSGPVHYEDDAGRWKDISTRLQRGEKAIGMGLGNVSLWNEENGLRTFFPNSSAQPIRFKFKEGYLSIKPVSDSKTTAKIGNDQVEYANVWNDANLVYLVRAGLVKEEIVVRRPNQMRNYSFEIEAKGVTYCQDAEGGISFLDKNGEQIWYLPPAFMYEQRHPEKYKAVPMKLRHDEKGKSFLDVTPDPSWMDALERSYPVIIDPTVVLGGINRQEQNVRHYYFQTLSAGPLNWAVTFSTQYNLLTAEEQPYLKIGTSYGGSNILNVLGPTNQETWSSSGRVDSLAAGNYHVTLFGGRWIFLVTLGYGTASLDLTYNRVTGSGNLDEAFSRSLTDGEVVADFQVIKAQTINGSTTTAAFTGALQAAPYFKIMEVAGSTETVRYSHTQTGTTQTFSLNVTPGITYRIRACHGTSVVTTSADHYSHQNIAVSGSVNFPCLTSYFEKSLVISTTPNKIASTIVAPSTQQVMVNGRISRIPDSSNVRSPKPYLKIMDGSTTIWPTIPEIDTIAYSLYDQATYLTLVKGREYKIEFACGQYTWTKEITLIEPDPPEFRGKFEYRTYTTIADRNDEVKICVPNSAPMIGAALAPANASFVKGVYEFKVPVTDPDWNDSTLANKLVMIDLKKTLAGSVEQSVILSENAAIPADGVFTGLVDLLSRGYKDGDTLYWSARVYDGFVWSASTTFQSFTIDATNPTIDAAATVGSDNSIKVTWTASDTNMNEFVLTYSNGSSTQSFTLGASYREHTLLTPGFNLIYQVTVTALDKAGNAASDMVSSIYTLPEQSKLYQPVSAKFSTTTPAAVVFKQVAAESYKIERTDKTTSTTVSTAYLTPQNLTAGPDVVDGGTSAKTFCYNPPTDAQSGWTITPHHVYQYRITTTNKRPTTPDTAVYTVTDIPMLNNVPVLTVTPPATLSKSDVSIQASATDLDGDALQFRFELYLSGETTAKYDSGWKTSGSHVFFAVTNGIYKWVVSVKDGYTDGTVSQTATTDQYVEVDGGLPDTPTLLATGMANAVRFSWNRSTDHYAGGTGTGSGIDHYVLQKKEGTTWVALATITDTGLSSYEYTISGLSYNSAVTARIEAVDKAGNESVYSTPITGYSLAQAGTLQLREGSDTTGLYVEVTMASATGAQSYTVKRDGTSIHTTLETFRDYGMSSHATHTYTVTTTNTAGDPTESQGYAITLANHLPVFGQPTVPQYVNSRNVTLSIPVSDLDKDTPQITYLWSSDGTTFTALTGDTLSAPSDGTFYWKARANDGFGTIDSQAYTVVVDTVQPVVTRDNTSSSYAPSQTVTVTASDEGSGLNTVKYRWNGGSWVTRAVPFTATAPNQDGNVLDVSATDNAGNDATVSWTYKVDSIAPVLTRDNTSTSYAQSQTVTVSASDALSGVNTVKYRWNGGTWVTTAVPFTVTAPNQDSNLLDVSATDYAGNSATVSWTYLVDSTGPVVTRDNTSTSYAQSQIVTITVSDALSGASTVQYRWNGGSWTTKTVPFTVSAPNQGSNVLEVSAVDNVGNSTTVSWIYLVDSNPPVVVLDNTSTSYALSQIVTVTASDEKSGVNTVQYRWNSGSWVTQTVPFTVTAPNQGSNVLEVSATDNADNNTTASWTYLVDSNPPVISNGNLDLPGTSTKYSSSSSVTASWNIAHLSEIRAYQYAFVTDGQTKVFRDITVSGTSAGFGGTFSHGKTYTLWLRAQNELGSWSADTALGTFIYDSTPPTGTLTLQGGQSIATREYVVSSMNVMVQTVSFNDPESGIVKTEFGFQAEAGGPIVWRATWDLLKTEIQNQGLKRFAVYARAQNGAASWGVSSPVQVVVDDTPAELNVLAWRKATPGQQGLGIEIGARDPESGLQSLRYKIGTTSGGDDISAALPGAQQGWLSIPAVASQEIWLGMTLGAQTDYYVTVEAVNDAGLVKQTVVVTPPPGTPVVRCNPPYSADGRINVNVSIETAQQIAAFRYRVERESDGSYVSDWNESQTNQPSTSWLIEGLEAGSYIVHVEAHFSDNALSPEGVSPAVTVDTTSANVELNVPGFAPQHGLIVRWTSEDLESGCILSRLTLGLEHAGQKQTLSPISLDGGVQGVFVVDSSLFSQGLQQGDKVYVTLEVTNGAGLVKTVSAAPVTVDTTGPDVFSVALTGEFTNSASIWVRWPRGSYDAESGIREYQYAVFTTPYLSDSPIVPWTKSVNDSWAQIDLGTPVANTKYFVAVKAINGAGIELTEWSDGGIIYDPTKPDTLWVNAGDYATSRSSLTVSIDAADEISGVTSIILTILDETGAELASEPVPVTGSKPYTHTFNGLSLQEGAEYTVVAVVTDGAGNSRECRSAQVMVATIAPTMNANAISCERDFVVPGEGTSFWWTAASAGTAPVDEYEYAYAPSDITPTTWSKTNNLSSITLTLNGYTDGQHVSIYVRAVDRAGLISEPAVKEVTIDSSAPVIAPIALQHAYIHPGTEIPVTASDSTSGITKYRFAIGTAYGESNVTPGWLESDSATLKLSDFSSLVAGQTYYFSAMAQNGAGTWSCPAQSQGYMLDATAPGQPTVTVPAFAPDKDSIAGIKFGASDAESGIIAYSWTLKDKNTSALVGANTIETQATSLTIDLTPNSTLVEGGQYIVELKVQNGAGVWSEWIASQTITVDSSAPVVAPLALQHAFIHLGTEITIEASDPTSGVTKYRFAVGTTYGGSEATSGWLESDSATLKLSSLSSLVAEQTYYFSVEAQNGAGTWSDPVQTQGYRLDTTPPAQPVVTVPAYTQDKTQIRGVRFEAADAESGIIAYSWTLRNKDTGAVVCTKTITTGASSLTADLTPDTTLVEGGHYVVELAAQNGAGVWSATAISSTITVDSIKPVITITSQPPAVVNESSIQMAWTIDEEGCIVQAALAKVGGDVTTVGVEPDGAGTYSYLFDLTDSGLYTVTITAIDRAGNQAQFSFGCRKNATPSIFISYPAELRVGESGAFSVTASDADGSCVSYLWSFGDGETSTEMNPAHHYAMADEYTVTLEVTDNDGGTTETTGKVLVNNTVSGTLLADEVWDAETFIDGDIIVPQGVTLTIKNGVNVTFRGNFGIFVYGTLKVEGQQTSRVTFKPLFANRNSWKGIRFEDAAASSIQYADIQWATVGLSIVRSMVTVSNCTFSWLSYGIHVYNSTPVIDSCQFIDITMYGIKEDAGGMPTVSNCVFTHTTGTTYVGDYYDQELTILTPDELNTLPGNSGNH